ncbi:retrovirus-related pol polyprotein from transposon TNT 1-94 [Tanacetum coccineum]
MTESPLVDSGFAVPVFSSGDGPIACLNKAMAFLTAVASSRFPLTNNQLRTSSNPRNQATIQDGKVIVQQVQGRQGVILVLVIRVILLVLGETMLVDRQGLLNATTVKVKDIWLGNALSLSDQVMQHDLGVPNGQAVQTIILNNAAFQTEDLDTYDSNCDDISNAKAILMANISNYGSDDFEQTLTVDFTNNKIHSDSNIILYSQYLQETQQENVQDTNLQAQQDSMILSVIEQMSEQMINHVNNWEKANKEQNNESVTAELERYKERVKTFVQRLNIDLSSREKMIDSQIDDMIKEKLALKEQVDSLEQNLSKQIKEKECLLQTFTVFKSESKEKEDKYMENKIDLEKKIKELDNILFKVGQSAQTVHMLTKPQAFYDNIHKQALEFFENNDLKALLQDKDITICKLKEIIKSMREKSKEENVNYDNYELETKNVELENSVAKLLSENKRLCNEINHVKQDLKAQIKDKVFVITSLKNNLQKVKGKEIVDIAAQIPYANTIVPGMFKLDLEPLAPRITSANVVLPKKTTSHSVETQKPELKVYSRKPKNVKNIGSSKHAKIIESKNANHSKPNHTWGSNAIDISSSSSLVMTGVDLISESRDTNLYTISLDDILKTSLICLLSKASKTKSWLLHRRLSHLNFGTLNKLAKDGLARGIPRLKFQKDNLCSACALGKSKKSSHQPKAEDTNQEKTISFAFGFVWSYTCGSINGERLYL